MLGVLVSSERGIIRKRVNAGLARAKATGGLRPEPVLFGEIVFGTKLRCDPGEDGQTVGVGLLVDGTGKCIPTSIDPDHLDREIATARLIGANLRDDHLL